MITELSLGHQHLIHFLMNFVECLVDLLSIRFHIEESADVLDVALPTKLLHDLVQILLGTLLV